MGLWDNPRIVVGIRCDSGLYSAAKPVLKARFGSVCRAVESYFAAVLSCANQEVNFGSTVEIGNIVIERNIRPRKKLDPSKMDVAEMAKIRVEERAIVKAAEAEVRQQEKAQVVMTHEADVGMWAEKVLEALPVQRGTKLGPVYDAIRLLEVPLPLQMDVKEAVVDQLSKGGD